MKFLQRNHRVKAYTMKFKASTLTQGKRATFERTTKWLIDLSRGLQEKQSRLDELSLAFKEAESRKNQFEQDAAFNQDAALNLAGAEAQLSRLAQEIRQLQQSLERETAAALRQVNTVRSSELRELLFGPLTEQLRTQITAAISPFFVPDWARHHANQIMQHHCTQYRQIVFYLNRPPVTSTEFTDAKSAIDALVGELKQILAGETLIEA